jgi:predicted small secreted protein
MRAVLLAALLLAGCASRPSLVDVLAGDRVDGDADGVLVRGFGDDVASATPFAVAHCSRYGRSAQYAARSGKALRFRCTN